VLVACSVLGGGSSSSASPTASTPQGTPSATVPPPEFPKTVTDLLGRDVELRRPPGAIVALSQTALELVYAVGGEVVGKPAGATYPPEAAAAADVGDAYSPDLAAVLALNPDLVVADSGIHSPAAIRSALDALGVPVVFAGTQNYGQVLTALSVVGAATGHVLESQVAVDGVVSALLEAKATLGEPETTAIALVSDRSGTLYAALDASFIGDVMRELGITNPAGSGAAAGPYPGYATISPEELARYNPGVVFTISTSPPPAPQLSSALLGIPGLAGLTAIANEDVVELDSAQALQSPGPRVIELIDAIVAAVGAVP
jgi:iron complex transport system substrate-binding protein